MFQAITGIWNLDFFRYIYPPFCISIHYSTLQVLAFEYIIALYPLVLITTAYICIELYDKNYRVIVYMWKPFSWCLLSIRKCNVLNLNAAKYSIVNAFASFIILSYSKIFITCCNFFKSTQLYKVDGQIVYEDGMKYQYYLSYVQCFSTVLWSPTQALLHYSYNYTHSFQHFPNASPVYVPY